MVVVFVLGFVVAVNGLLLLYRYVDPTGTTDPVPLAAEEEEPLAVPPTVTQATTAAPEPTEESLPPKPPEPEPVPLEPGPSEPESPEPAQPVPEDDAPLEDIPPTLVDALAGCQTAVDGCVAAYVAGIAPEAEYVEEVPDANSSPSEGNRLFYFRDPTLAPCQYSWEDYTFGDSIYYTVVIYGEGSFNEDGSGCIPAF